MIRKHIKSIILIASVLLLALISLLIINLTKEPGSYVEVVIDGVVVERYSLSDEVEKTITTSSDSYNILIIKDNKAYIEDASCPDHICVNHKKISYVGETITCLPNKVVIVIKGTSDIDIIV